MKYIKDYLHLYLKCWGVVTGAKDNDQNGEWVLTGKRLESVMLREIKFKPILRPLSDMTEEEADMIISIRKLDGVYREDSKVAAAIDCVTGYTWPNTFQAAAEATRYLLSKHFDLFGLIESGLAIDKSK